MGFAFSSKRDAITITSSWGWESARRLRAVVALLALYGAKESLSCPSLCDSNPHDASAQADLNRQQRLEIFGGRIYSLAAFGLSSPEGSDIELQRKCIYNHRQDATSICTCQSRW